MSLLRTVWTVMVKELRDLSRDRRTLALSLLLAPLLYPVLILGMSKLSEMRVRTQLEAPLQVPVVGAGHAPTLVAFLASVNLHAVDPPKDLAAAIQSQQVDVALRISEDFAENWRDGRPALVEIVYDSTRRDADIPSARLRSALEAYSGQVGALRLVARGIDAQVVRPLDIARQDLATAEAKRGVLLSVLLPVLLTLTSFLGGAYLVMDTTAGERERQSLEPLLVTPASRSAIVSGKIAAACVIGLLTLLLTLLAFKISASLAGGSIGQMLKLGIGAMAQMLLVMLPMLFIGTTLLTLLSASAKSLKEAQSHMTWLMLLPMLPGYALMVYPIKSALWQFAVPFLAQNQMLIKLIRQEPISVQTWAVYLGAGIALSALLWAATVYRYNQERLAISG
ncbi:ABC transporter permease [Stenotrophomonas koreensis]|uniref:ABC transporter permease n=1 Tax=Stenotrophomonas koreensis TaxID=266128 RepID=UPI0033912EE7